MSLNEFEQKSGHRRAICDPLTERCINGYCSICELYLCKICGGFEGSLLPQCPGHQLTLEEHDRNYEHYCQNTGPFAEKNK